MKELEEAILTKGKVLPGEILKVGSFLNHQIDTSLLNLMANDVVNHYKGKQIDKIITIEASGIAFATAIALKLNVPVVFAKKGMSSNVSGDVYVAEAYSYTHGKVNTILIPKDYLKEKENILIADDFLATGEATRALLDITNQAKVKVTGIAIEIEKCFQDGGDKLRSEGYDVHSLAIIESMSENKINFKK